MACDSLDDIPISASWSICLSGSTAGMAADLGTAATRCRQRVVEPLCRFAGGDLVETTLDQDDGHASLFRSRSPKSAPANCRTCAYGSELWTEALQPRGEPDLGWLMRHGVAPPEMGGPSKETAWAPTTRLTTRPMS